LFRTVITLLRTGSGSGNASLPRSQGISEKALDPAPYTAFGPNGESYTTPAFVVDDLALHESFKHRGYAGKGVSFYAGLPIISKSGFAIGVYTVTDNRPRSGLSAEELQFMHDMASTVGSHLDRIRNESARYRGNGLDQPRAAATPTPKKPQRIEPRGQS
jgi:GAF domain-containing protein